MLQKILVSKKSPTSGLLSRLDSSSFDYIVNLSNQRFSNSDLMAVPKPEDVVGIVAGTERLGREELDIFPNLRCVSRVGVGTDSIDITHARRKGIAVRTTTHSHIQPMIELNLALLLNLNRHLLPYHNEFRDGLWGPRLGVGLDGQAIGILGMGRIGRHLADALHTMGAKSIHFFDPEVSELDGDSKIRFRKMPSLDNFLQSSNVVFVLAPLNPQTRNLIDKSEIQKLPDEAIIINTSRGAIVSEQALIDGLRTGKLSGAASDVFTTEPYRGALQSLPNFIGTPHVGTLTYTARNKMEEEAVASLLEVLG